MSGTDFAGANHLLPQCGQSGSAVLLRGRMGLRSGQAAEDGAGDSNRMVSAGHSRLDAMALRQASNYDKNTKRKGGTMSNERLVRRGLLALVALAGVGLFTPAAEAQSLSELFAGRTINLMIGFG